MEVENVKTHRTKKEKKDMAQFERFAAEGNEKADELAKVGAMLDGCFMEIDSAVQKVLGICEAKNGTETDELLQVGTQRVWQNVEC